MIWPLSKILPVKRFPIIAVIILFTLIFFMVEFVILVMNYFCLLTGLSHMIAGLTIMVWGTDNIEMINLAISMA